MKKKKRGIYILLAVIIVGIVAILGAKAYFGSNLEHLSYVTISNMDLSKLKDGIYTGSYSAFPIAAKVKVILNNHRITGIELLEHSNGQGSIAEIIPEKVIKAQSLEVDIVSGATYSSKVILKAIEAALINANKE